MQIVKTPRFCKECAEWTTVLSADFKCAVCKSVVFTKKELKAVQS